MSIRNVPELLSFASYIVLHVSRHKRNKSISSFEGSKISGANTAALSGGIP